MSYIEEIEKVRIEVIEKELLRIKHCTVCKHFSIWNEEPEGAQDIYDCIPHSYCSFHKCVIDDKKTCEYFQNNLS